MSSCKISDLLACKEMKGSVNFLFPLPGLFWLAGPAQAKSSFSSSCPLVVKHNRAIKVNCRCLSHCLYLEWWLFYKLLQWGDLTAGKSNIQGKTSLTHCAGSNLHFEASIFDSWKYFWLSFQLVQMAFPILYILLGPYNLEVLQK